MAATHPAAVELSDDDRQVLESCLVSFDQSWTENALAPRARALPAAGNPLRLPLLVEMIKIDLDRRWQKGQGRSVEDYLVEFPELGPKDHVPADVLQTEYEARARLGETGVLEDLSRRFPGQAEALRRYVDESPRPNAESPTVNDKFGTIDTPGDSGSPRPADPIAAQLPEQFGRGGRYRIRKKLGQGGMGAVYLAHDTQLDRLVALKVPSSKDLVPEDLERFLREARAAASLHHANICPVHDVDNYEGHHYLTMAFIEGSPLSALLRSGPMTPRDAASLIRSIALALAEAHTKGIIHRDLKPANIMINLRGEPVIMDFGLARRSNTADVRITHSGALIGTPAYMSPEQMAGSVEDMGAGCDIYSLGVILYEMLTGKLPFTGNLCQLMVKVQTDAPESPSKHRPDIDPRLETACLKALAKTPNARYASMRELAAALTGYLDGEPAPTVLVGKPDPALDASTAKLPLPRRRMRHLLSLAAAAALLLVGVILVLNRQRDAVPKDQPRIEADKTTDEKPPPAGTKGQGEKKKQPDVDPVPKDKNPDKLDRPERVPLRD